MVYYDRALALASQIAEDKDGSVTSLIMSRSGLLLRTAMAADVFSHLQWRQVCLFAMLLGRVLTNFPQNLATQALATALQALRLANRALANLARLHASQRLGDTEEEHPQAEAREGQAQAAVLAASTKTPARPRHTLHTGSIDMTLGWETAYFLCDCLLWIAKLYYVKGSPRTVTYFLAQAYSLAESLAAPRMLAKVVVKQVELAIALRDEALVHKSMEELVKIAADDGGLASIEVKRLKACLASLDSEQAEASEAGFVGAQSALQKLDKAFLDTEAQIKRYVTVSKNCIVS